MPALSSSAAPVWGRTTLGTRTNGGFPPNNILSDQTDRTETAMIPSLAASDPGTAGVTCREVLKAAGWQQDGKPGPTFTKFRSPDRTAVILASDGGWLDPKLPPGSPGSRGNAVALMRRIHSCSAVEARQRLQAIWNGGQAGPASRPSPQQLWDGAPAPAPGTQGWHYLTQERRIPEWVVSEAVAADVLREGKGGIVLAKHVDATGHICGAELRASGKRPAFLGGGTKGACAMGPPPGIPPNGRVFVTEGIIDALAARALEAGQQGTAGTTYASTAGAFGVRTAAAISALLPAGGGHLVAGVDRGEVGESFAAHLRHVAAGSRATYSRAMPAAKDWAEDLEMMEAHAPTPRDSASEYEPPTPGF